MGHILRGSESDGFDSQVDRPPQEDSSAHEEASQDNHDDRKDL
jgi:hypothetical protein